MLTQIRRFIWPSKEEIANFDKLKWYQGLNFWYFVFVIVSLVVLKALFGIYEPVDYFKIRDIRYVAFMLIGAPFGSIFFLYLMYRHYVWAYFGMGLSYYVFDYAPQAKYYQVEQAYNFIPVYILGLLVFRINWYYRQTHSTDKLQLKKDCIIALLLMELFFYTSFMLFSY